MLSMLRFFSTFVLLALLAFPVSANTYFLTITSQVAGGAAAGGGGLFNASLYEDVGGSQGGLLELIQSQCIDYWNYFNYNETFRVRLSSLTQEDVSTYTRFGNFNDTGGGGPGQPNDFYHQLGGSYGALDRYKMNAYLANLYLGYVGASSQIRNALQSAMWELMRPKTYNASTWYTSATPEHSTQYWLNQAVQYGLSQSASFYSQWRIITEFPLNNLGGSKWQEHIVRVSVPEPATVALLLLDLFLMFLILSFFRKRMRSSAGGHSANVSRVAPAAGVE
jgi:hypothetical protein